MALTITNPYSIRLGVVGAGTMGSGIALVGLLAGMRVTLYELEPAALERARSYLVAQLERKNQLAGGLERLALTVNIEELAGAGVVIEAAAEDLAVKQALFARLDALCPPPAVLASNTSTLPVTAIAAGSAHPARVAGMHFFNPAAVMALVEVVRAAQTDEPTLQTLLSLAALMGKQPVIAADTPGFIVNRVARPFYGEALRLLEEGAAPVTTIDHIVRLGAGFRMGPFELMDLIGIDINLAATRSMYEQSFGETRYRPHPIQARMVQQNRLGRKTGHGFYPGGQPEPLPQTPKPPARRKNQAALLITAGTFAPGLGALARQAGWLVSAAPLTGERSAAPLIGGVAAAGQSEGLRRRLVELDALLPPDLPLFCQCGDVTLSEAAGWVTHPERLVGLDGLFFANGPAATFTSVPGLRPQVRQDAEAFAAHLGRVPFWVADTPALVLPRIVGQLINEAVFAVAAGVAEPAEIDRAMQSGANYPRGLLGWARTVGYERVLAVLDHLHAEYGEERYRAAALLRRWARLAAINI